MTNYCNRCEQRLNPKTMVGLEYDNDTGVYHDPRISSVPADHESLGLYFFGRDCAKAILTHQGEAAWA